MNVLVYSSQGTTTESVKHCLESLRLHLSPYYAVIPVTESTLLNEPWIYKTSLLVMPGGADLPYCRILNGEGNRTISKFVKKGGRFMGFCAGAYYASGRCEFEVGNPKMEVSGSRELSFFPGTSKGCAYKGFVYESHNGARVAPLSVNTAALPGCPNVVYNYYNGGGVFLNASSYENTEVLARYTESLDVEDQEKAAVVYCKVGKGAAVLSGTHPEFTASLMKPSQVEPNFNNIVRTLSDHEHERKVFLQSCLKKLGMKVNEDVDMSIPRITPIYLSSHLNPNSVSSLFQTLKQNLDFVNGNCFEDHSDTFCLHDASKKSENDLSYTDTESTGDPDSEIKHINFLTTGTLPDTNVTPYFNMEAYFDHLKELYNSEPGGIGSILGYGEVVTSTNTMLDCNPGWLSYLPHGFALTATTQVSGRGRGGNVWINPKGVMALSILFKIPSGSKNSSSIVTLQYLCGLALIELILGYGSRDSGIGYEDMPIKIKWPNDIFSLKPEYFNELTDKDKTEKKVEGDEKRYAKISGALINSQFLNNAFHLVWGGGVNVSNSAPTTSLNIVLERLNVLRQKKGLPALPPYKHELLLAKVMYTMDKFYEVFKHSGLSPFLPLYYKRWFHSNQTVDLDSEGNGSARTCTIKGITPDYGLLIVEDIKTSETLHLQPDGNSFDIFKGLVYKKT
ncbi:uncharacterized protein PRCAT00003164001 [Priceomyces carsonii]|uniref:uncharacterized protein n=1 Tax=Priceomyces carsonii TaxID=28549 RepID=UPI002ED8AE41|nr:unnamed protein product [Priceomyces carsonii]